jgi:hypothetical protein
MIRFEKEPSPSQPIDNIKQTGAETPDVVAPIDQPSDETEPTAMVAPKTFSHERLFREGKFRFIR